MIIAENKRVKRGTRDAYGETLVRLGQENEKVVVLDADLSGSTRTAKFNKAYPERFFNMGISEQDMIGTAAGLAIAGKIPFASTFAIFQTGRAWEQIRQAVCYPKLNVKLVASHGGFTVGEDGATHHCIEDIALMRVLPNMTVIVPADANEVQQAIMAAAQYHGPVYIRVSRDKTPVFLSEKYKFKIGKALQVKDGNDLTLISFGFMVELALAAACRLTKQGINARVINMSTIKPIDRQAIICAAKETGAIMTIEEHSIIGGLGSAVAEVLSEHYPCIMKRIGIRDHFCMSAKPHVLMEKFGFTTEKLAKSAAEFLKKNKG